MIKKNDDFLWCEKYRPTNVDDCILPASIKNDISLFVKKQQIPHFLFSGSAGIGKTSVSKAIADEMEADLLFINASNESGIDVIRNKVVQFASTASFDGNLKIVLLDEADRITQNGQDALKAIMEEFSKNTRFILTCNNKNRLIDPLQSRCTPIDFKVSEEEKKSLMAQMMKRSASILKAENVDFDTNSLVVLVKKYFPDFRRTINALQKYSVNGAIDAGVLVADATNFDELIISLRAKKFMEVRKWIAKNTDMDSATFFRYFFDNLSTLFENKCIPDVILVLSEYQKSAAIVVDQEINNIAAMIDLMGAATWK